MRWWGRIRFVRALWSSGGDSSLQCDGEAGFAPYGLVVFRTEGRGRGDANRSAGDGDEEVHAEAMRQRVGVDWCRRLCRGRRHEGRCPDRPIPCPVRGLSLHPVRGQGLEGRPVAGLVREL